MAMPKNRITQVTIDIEEPDHDTNSAGHVMAYVQKPRRLFEDDLVCVWTGDLKKETVVDVITGKSTVETTYGTRWEDDNGKEVTPPWYAKCVERALQGFLRGRDEMDSDVAEERGNVDLPADLVIAKNITLEMASELEKLKKR